MRLLLSSLALCLSLSPVFAGPLKSASDLKLSFEGGLSAVFLPVSQDAKKKDEEVERWIKDLGSDDFEVRETATEKLIENFKQAETVLLELKNNSKDAEVQARLGYIFKEGQRNPALRALERKLSPLCKQKHPTYARIAAVSQDEKEMAELLDYLSNFYMWARPEGSTMDTKDAEYLIQAAAVNLNSWKIEFVSLRNSTKFFLLRAMHDNILDKSWGHDAVPLIQNRIYELLEDKNSMIRGEALMVLARHGQHPKIMERARILLKDRSEDVRPSAIYALQLGKSKEDAPAILRLAEKDPSDTVRWYALEYMGEVLSKDNAEALRIVLAAINNQDGLPLTKKYAIDVLARWGAVKEHKEAIRPYLKDDLEILRVSALEAWKQVKEK